MLPVAPCRTGGWVRAQRSGLRSTLRRGIEHSRIPRVLSGNVPDDEADAGVGGDKTGGHVVIGADLEAGEQRGTVQDEELQVGCVEELGGEVSALAVRVVLVLTHLTGQSGRTSCAQGEVRQVIQQVRHQGPSSDGDQALLHTAPH